MSESLSKGKGADVFEQLRSLPSGDDTTHEVMNRTTPFIGHNAFSGDRLPGEIAERERVGRAQSLLAEAGQTVASGRVAKVEQEGRARRVAEKMAIALQASLLIRRSPSNVADAFCATRIADDGGAVYGSLPAGLAQRSIIERAPVSQ
jgi:hypothetical protein